MNKKLVTLAVIIILDIILLAAAEKMPTIDYLALGEWDTLDSGSGRIQLEFGTNRSFLGTYYPQEGDTSLQFDGTYSIYNKTVHLQYNTARFPGLNIQEARFEYLKNNADYDYALVFENRFLYNIKEPAKEGKKVRINTADCVVVEEEKVRLLGEAQYLAKPEAGAFSYAFNRQLEAWKKHGIIKGKMYNSNPVTLLARTRRRSEMNGEKDYWYYVSLNTQDVPEPFKCWIHGSSVVY